MEHMLPDILPPDWKQQLLKVYPKRQGQGWVDAKRWIEKHLDNGEDWDEMLFGANAYRLHIVKTGEFVKMARTFFGPQMFWLEYDDEECDNEVTLDDEARMYQIERQDGESDASLKHRLGIAMTQKIHA